MMSDPFTSLRPKQNGCHFADDCYKCIFLNENVQISNKISLKFVPEGQMNNIPALVQIMAWRRPGNKPLSEPMVFSLLTHICVTRPQWVKKNRCQRHRDAAFPAFLITRRFFLWSLTKRASNFFALCSAFCTSHEFTLIPVWTNNGWYCHCAGSKCLIIIVTLKVDIT